VSNSRVADSVLYRPAVQGVLERLHALADTQDDAILQRVHEDAAWKSATPKERATLLGDAP
jgi:hypothetical protein